MFYVNVNFTVTFYYFMYVSITCIGYMYSLYYVMYLLV